MSTQNTAVVKPGEKPPQKPSALALMASRLSVEPAKLHATLKATVFKNASDDEMLALVVVSNEYGLNPLLKEIYAFPAKGGGIVQIVSVDGWNKMLIRHPDFDGIEFEFTDGQDGNPYSCTATIYVKNRNWPVKVTEYFSECHRNTDPWNNMPRRMLRNRTLCQAVRMAFGFSGVYNDDEAQTIVDVQSVVLPTEPPPKLVAAPAPETKLSPQAELEGIITAGGFNLQHLVEWGKLTGNINDADSLTQISELSAEVAKRLLKAQKGLLAGLADVKGGNVS